MGESGESGWAVAMAEPYREDELHRNLRRAGWRVVYLTYRHLLTGHDRPNWRTATDFVWRPLFPGYLFFELWPGQALPRADRTPGYLDVVRKAGRVPNLLDYDTVWGWQMLVRTGIFDDHRPAEAAAQKSEYKPANCAEERAKILGELLDRIDPRRAAS